MALFQKKSHREARYLYAIGGRDENMNILTFQTAVKLAIKNGYDLVIGGGEPTVHPRFWDFIALATTEYLKAMGKTGCPKVWLATNGKNEQAAIMLARMAELGVLCVRLSRDQYHSRIKSSVKDAFRRKRIGIECDQRGETITDLSQSQTMNHGRAEGYGGRTCCACPGTFIRPKGTIHECGCKDSEQVGTVFRPGKDFHVSDYSCGSLSERAWQKGKLRKKL